MVMHPKALFWKKSFLEIEDQNLLSGARSVLTFGRRSYQILVRHFSTCWLRALRNLFDMESIGMKLIFDLIVNVLSELCIIDCIPVLKLIWCYGAGIIRSISIEIMYFYVLKWLVFSLTLLNLEYIVWKLITSLPCFIF